MTESAFLDSKPLPNRAALPTAPRSAQPAELDFSKLPDKPPYTVYLGNIPFDADEDDITLFLRDCNVRESLLDFCFISSMSSLSAGVSV